jgi:uncharacterized repeat protein (TIGR03803 family)
LKTLKIALGRALKYKNFCGVILFCAVTAMVSRAQTLTTLLNFNETNGANPLGIIQGFDGNFYGTTLVGGSQNLGTAFKLTPSGALTIEHNFCANGGNCLDGGWPEGRMIEASNGDLYGPTDLGGSGDAGVIYRITRAGKFSVVHNFCIKYPCADGVSPISVVQGRNGRLYGTTYGSRNNDSPDLGTVFELTLGGRFTPLHSFSGPDGSYPQGALLAASNGNFYGTTTQGGSSQNCGPLSLPGCGTVFQITPSGTFTTVHIFDGSDGAFPGYGESLIEGTDGSLYGTATYGGTAGPTECAFGCGTIFAISPTGEFTTLYNFCSQLDCSDGAIPVESLVQGTDGNLYGTTEAGGNRSGGTIFKITRKGELTTLYNFCSQANCADGSAPEAALIQATDGSFYGTTYSGGPNNSGTIFRFSMGLSPFVRLVRNSGKVGETGYILGQGLTGTTAVFLNGTSASFTVVSDTIIRAIVPAGATSGFVTVKTPNGTLKSNVPFRVIP